MSSCSAGSTSPDKSIHYNPELYYNRMMEMIEEDLMCPVCREVLEEPQLLTCAHVLCKACLEALIQSSIRRYMPLLVRCPVCRQEILTTGADRPKTNHLLKAIIENYTKTKDFPRPPMCEVHAEQPLNMFCATDMKLICGVCSTSEEHKQHAFSSIAEAYNQEKDSLQGLILGLENQHDYLSLLQTIKTNKAKAFRVLSMKAEKISDYMERLKEELEQRKTRLLSEVEGMKAAVMQTYDLEITKLDVLLIEQEKAQKMAQDCQDISNPYLFLQQMQEIRETIGSINKVTLPCVPDNPVNPAMETFGPSLWNNTKLMNLDQLDLSSRNLTKRQKAQPNSPCSVLALFIGLLIFASLVAMVAFHSISSSDDQVTFNDYNTPVRSYLEDIGGKALENISVYSRLMAREIYSMAGMCWAYISDFMQHVALSVSSFIYRKDREKILYLGMEEKTTSVSPTVMPNSELTILSQNHELHVTSLTDHHPAMYQYGHMAGSYLTMIIVKTAEQVSAYWWSVVREMLGLGERCRVYVMAFVDQMAGFN